jgi:hypothetical protein
MGETETQSIRVLPADRTWRIRNLLYNISLLVVQGSMTRIAECLQVLRSIVHPIPVFVMKTLPQTLAPFAVETRQFLEPVLNSTSGRFLLHLPNTHTISVAVFPFFGNSKIFQSSIEAFLLQIFSTR